MSAPALARTAARQPRENAIDRLITRMWETRRDGLTVLLWLAVFLPVAWFLLALGD